MHDYDHLELPEYMKAKGHFWWGIYAIKELFAKHEIYSYTGGRILR